jgi:hypothetical protein
VTLEIDPAELSHAVGRPVATYTMEALDPHLRIHSVTGGVFRVRGDDWSLVLKIVRHGEDDDPGALWVSGADASHRNYWKREWLAFDSGLLAQLPGKLRAPRALLTTQRGDRECWIWMEDAPGRHSHTLHLDDYTTIARALGTTQGAYAAGHPLPEMEWLSRDWLRGWLTSCGRLVALLDDDDAWTDERLAPLARLRDRTRALWQQRDRLLAISSSGPATVGHWDFWPANLFVDDEDHVVAVDWSQVGIASLGQDLDQLTLDTVWMQVRPDESLDALENAVLPAYADGLQEAGADVGLDQVRLWHAASASVRYVWMGCGQATIVADPDAVRGQERRFGTPYDVVLAHKARVVEHAIELGEWALESA